MQIRGINYDVGTEFFQGESSRGELRSADVVREIRAIRDDLHATHVNVYGTSLRRLEEAAAIVLQEGLAVSLQQRSIEATRGEMLRDLAETARAAERLRAAGDVTLNTGCELTLFLRGFLPGRTFMSRIRHLVWSWPLLPFVYARLNRHLRRVTQVAREHFGGPITYSAGIWERLDWSAFDLVGVNLYRDHANEASYLSELRALHRHGKPVVITEFGCCTYEGADKRGGDGWRAVDFDRTPAAMKRGYRRSERAQATYLGELLDLFIAEAIHGAYVYDFMATALPHDPDPARDLDMASYGIVKVFPALSGETMINWHRKEGFDAVARRYRELAARRTS